MSNEITFTDELWARAEEGYIVVGIKQDMFEDINEIWGLDLPEEGSDVDNEEVCGELETDEGPVNLYSPLEGEVVEINSSISTDPNLLFDDSVIEGWLFKVNPTDPQELEKLMDGENNGEED